MSQEMKWGKADQVHIANLVKLLQKNARFDNMTVADNMELAHCFAWIDKLKSTIDHQIQMIENPPLIPKPAAPQPVKEEPMEEVVEEPKKKRRSRKKKD